MAPYNERYVVLQTSFLLLLHALTKIVIAKNVLG